MKVESREVDISGEILAELEGALRGGYNQISLYTCMNFSDNKKLSVIIYKKSF